ncbi:hypothetical protein BDB01DRAFT_895876 [Pilobolus umbonatus]|nr:hypothetical protein BDB01DRAFT_895876 [Pilobolus umbonatus]
MQDHKANEGEASVFAIDTNMKTSGQIQIQDFLATMSDEEQDDISDRDLIPILFKSTSRLNSGIYTPTSGRRQSISSNTPAPISIPEFKGRQSFRLFASNVSSYSRKTPYTSAAVTPAIGGSPEFGGQEYFDNEEYENEDFLLEEDNKSDFLQSCDYSLNASLGYVRKTHGTEEWDPYKALETLKSRSESMVLRQSLQEALEKAAKELEEKKEEASSEELHFEKRSTGDLTEESHAEEVHVEDNFIDKHHKPSAFESVWDSKPMSLPSAMASGRSSPRTPVIEYDTSDLSRELELEKERYKQQRVSLTLSQPQAAVASVFEAELDLSRGKLGDQNFLEYPYSLSEQPVYSANIDMTSYENGSSKSEESDHPVQENSSQKEFAYYDKNVYLQAQNRLNALIQGCEMNDTETEACPGVPNRTTATYEEPLEFASQYDSGYQSFGFNYDPSSYYPNFGFDKDYRLIVDSNLGKSGNDYLESEELVSPVEPAVISEDKEDNLTSEDKEDDLASEVLDDGIVSQDIDNGIISQGIDDGIASENEEKDLSSEEIHNRLIHEIPLAPRSTPVSLENQKSLFTVNNNLLGESISLEEEIGSHDEIVPVIKAIMQNASEEIDHTKKKLEALEDSQNTELNGAHPIEYRDDDRISQTDSSISRLCMPDSGMDSNYSIMDEMTDSGVGIQSAHSAPLTTENSNVKYGHPLAISEAVQDEHQSNDELLGDAAISTDKSDFWVMDTNSSTHHDSSKFMSAYTIPSIIQNHSKNLTNENNILQSTDINESKNSNKPIDIIPANNNIEAIHSAPKSSLVNVLLEHKGKDKESIENKFLATATIEKPNNDIQDTPYEIDASHIQTGKLEVKEIPEEKSKYRESRVDPTKKSSSVQLK